MIEVQYLHTKTDSFDKTKLVRLFNHVVATENTDKVVAMGRALKKKLFKSTSSCNISTLFALNVFKV